MITLSHTTAREYIQQMADGEALRLEARQALQHHLTECAECRRYAQEIKALHQTLSRAFRDRWEHQPLPHRAWPPVTRSAARQWSPLAQVMMMLTMTVMVLSLLPEWSRWPAGPPTPAPTETRSAPVTLSRQIEAIPDEGLESLTSHEVNEALERLETPDKDDSAEVYPYYLNDPDHRASRAQ